MTKQDSLYIRYKICMVIVKILEKIIRKSSLVGICRQFRVEANRIKQQLSK